MNSALTDNAAVSAEVTKVSGTTITVTVKGTDVEPDDLDPSEWGTFNEPAVVLQLNPQLNGNFTIVQTNPSLEHYYNQGDNNIAHSGDKYIKTKTYTGITENDLLDILVINNDEITVEYYKGAREDNILAAKFIVKPSLTFKA